MPAKPTSTLPGHRSEAASSTTTTPTTATVDPHPATSWRHSAWIEIADGLVQRCPDPEGFRVHPDRRIASLQLSRPVDVAAWAAFLGLPVPGVQSWIPDDEPTIRLVHTSSTGVVDGVRWFVDHTVREPVDPDPGTDRAIDDDVTTGGGESE